MRVRVCLCVCARAFARVSAHARVDVASPRLHEELVLRQRRGQSAASCDLNRNSAAELQDILHQRLLSYLVYVCVCVGVGGGGWREGTGGDVEHQPTRTNRSFRRTDSLRRRTVGRTFWGLLTPSLPAPACKISGLKDARTRLQTVHFPVL